MAEAAILHFEGKIFEFSDLCELLIDDVEPAEPCRFVFASPERSVVFPELLYFSGLPVTKVFFYRIVQIGRKFRALPERFGAPERFVFFSTASSNWRKESATV